MSLMCIDLYETDGLLLFRSKSIIFQTIDLERVIEKAENIFNFYLDFNWELDLVESPQICQPFLGKYIRNTQDFPPSATVWHKRLLALRQLNVCAMLEIIISVALYAAAIVFLIKSAFAYCNRSGHDIVTEP